jgi:nitrate reductase (NAD(P)H)
MGMGNNHAFRVKVHVCKTAEGEHVFRFEHPTQPGQQSGGWMTTPAGKPESAGFGRLLEVQGDSNDDGPVAPPKDIKDEKKLFTAEEVAKHNKEDDVWIIVKDKVYNCTEYLELHPGGVDSIMINAGSDSTEDFLAIHSSKAAKMLEKFYIGDLDKSSVQKVTEDKDDICSKTGRPIALNPKKKRAFKLQAKTVLSHDSFMLDFALPTPEHVLGLDTGKHMFLSNVIGGETVMRRYTPISSNYDIGCVKFVIKSIQTM